MSQPIHQVVADRRKFFKPDVIMSIVYAGSQFDVIRKDPIQYVKLA